MMWRGAVALGGETGVTAFPVWVTTNIAAIADNTDRMIKVRLTELLDECMEPSCGGAP
jgi:hypothetical protein